MPKITYEQALQQALVMEMRRDPSVVVYGIGAPDCKRIFGTTNGLVEEFGEDRCFDTPLSEEAMTGVGIGMAISGMRPVHVHIRADFVLLAMNQIVNNLATLQYGSAGRLECPMVIRLIVGRGWGQGYQHSKTLHSYFAHIPGLQVIAPSTPRDAKGMLTAAIRSDEPTICIEHRWLYFAEEDVPANEFTIPAGKANVSRKGRDLTIVATSWMVVEALQAAEIAGRKHDVSIEVVDIRSLVPLDEDTLVVSVNKTHNCIVADNDWSFCGYGAEIAAMLSEKCFSKLQTPVTRVGFAHHPCPTARHLESEFYPNAETLVREIEKKLHLAPCDLSDEKFFSHEHKFKGPF